MRLLILNSNFVSQYARTLRRVFRRRMLIFCRISNCSWWTGFLTIGGDVFFFPVDLVETESADRYVEIGFPQTVRTRLIICIESKMLRAGTINPILSRRYQKIAGSQSQYVKFNPLNLSAFK